MLASNSPSLIAFLRPLIPGAALSAAMVSWAGAAPQCSLPADQLEPNGQCSSATNVALPYAVSGLNVGFGDDDLFLCTVPAGVILEATVTVSALSDDFVVVGIVDGNGCVPLSGAGFAIGFVGGTGTARWANRTGAPALVGISCRNDLFACGLYDLALDTVQDPCASPIVDAFEPNDNCATATPLLPGSYPGLRGAIASLDPDVFKIVIPPGELASIDAAAVTPGAVMSLEPWSAQCGLPALPTEFGEGALAVLNRGPSAVEFAFRASILEGNGYTEVACGEYELTVSSAPSPCVTIPPDAFEPNDSCAAARPISSGFYPGLTVESPGDADWYSADIRRGEQLTLEISLSSQSAPLIPLFQRSCAFGLVPFLTETPTGFRAIWANNSLSDYDAQFGVQIAASMPVSCSWYDMTVTIGPIMDPCPPDPFEDNDDCATATPLGDGLYTGLHIGAVDSDHYEFEVAPGSLLTIEVIADNQGGRGPRFEVYDVNTPCVGIGDIARGRSLFRGRTAQWINDTGQVHRVRAAIQLSGLFDACAEYDLLVLGTTTPGLLGDQFCPSEQNSLFTRVLTLAEGSTSLSAQDLSLVAQPLPTNSNGFFLYSRTQAPPTPVSGGLLCLGSPIVRLNGFVFNSTNTGLATLQLPYGALPVPIAPGETWNFQYWYRNFSGGQGSNFGTGLTLQFTP